MSQEIRVVLWCDPCGGRTTEAVETITVGMDGTWREMEVCAKHSEALSEFVRPYMLAGRPPGREPRPYAHRAVGVPQAKPLSPMGEARRRNKAIREYGRQHGWGELPEGCYIPKPLIAEWESVQREQQSA